MKKIKLLGVIPARKGSRGLKNKNLLKVGVKPLIAYTIKDALSYKQIDHVVVSTDSPKIASVARKYGAEIPFMRPGHLARDSSPMLAVLKHALMKCESHYNCVFDGIVLLDPTSPIRKKNDINGMIKIFKTKKPDLVVAGRSSRRNPYFNMLAKNKDGYANLVIKSKALRRQDAPITYDITNNCWIFSRKAIQNNWRLPRKTLMYEIKGDYIDIDTPDDLKHFASILRK